MEREREANLQVEEWQTKPDERLLQKEADT